MGKKGQGLETLEEFQDKRGRKPTVTVPARFEPKFWEDADSRCAVVKGIRRRYRELREDAGGKESCQRDLLVQRAVFLSVILETQEVRAAEGESIDLGSYTQGVNALQGLLKTLGLEKQVKNVTDLQGYLERKRGRDGR